MQTIGYVRVSTDKQADRGVSLEAQVEKIRAMAVVHNGELLDIIVDGGESAKSLNRPGMARLLAQSYRPSFPANSGLDVTRGTFCHLASCTNPAGAGRAMKGPRTEPSAKRKRYNSRPLQSHFGGEAVSLPMHFAHSITVTVHLASSDEVLVCA